MVALAETKQTLPEVIPAASAIKLSVGEKNVSVNFESKVVVGKWYTISIAISKSIVVRLLGLVVHTVYWTFKSIVVRSLDLVEHALYFNFVVKIVCIYLSENDRKDHF